MLNIHSKGDPLMDNENRIDILESIDVKPYKFVDAKIIKTNLVTEQLN